jgi:hypothetical protein
VRIGRLSFGIIVGEFGEWSLDRAICNCLILSLGRVYITWTDKECVCRACDQYDCKCPDDPYFCECCENNPCDCTDSGHEP